MKIIKCKWFPPSGNKAIALLPFIIVRAKMFWSFTEYDENHECIHLRQQLEMLIFGALMTVGLWLLGCGWWSLFALPLFFYWYGIEYLIRLCIYRNHNAAYKNVAFEQEAYDNQDKIDYNDSRKLFAWIKYYKKQ